MKLVVVGAGGRMGQSLIRAIASHADVELSGAIERIGAKCIGLDAGIHAGSGENGIKITDDPLAAFAKCEGVLDFTIPAASIEYNALSAQTRIVHIIGTTGFEPEQENKIAAGARHARVVKSGNMSMGVNLLAALVEKAANALNARDFDIEVLEMHHRHKIDAPSGTALLLGEAAAQGREIELSKNSVRSRDGITGARKPGDIGFATLRGGSVVGEHSVIMAGEGEVIELTHKATDRALFANGAITAALWARDKKPGLYSMKDVLGL